eukprot:2360106-Prorocentrum_lima.AAC.1
MKQHTPEPRWHFCWRGAVPRTKFQRHAIMQHKAMHVDSDAHKLARNALGVLEGFSDFTTGALHWLRL